MNGRSWWGSGAWSSHFKLTGMIICTWKFAINAKTYNTILQPPPSPFRKNHIALVLSVSCTVSQYQLLQCKREYFNTFHDWLSQYEDYRDFEGISSFLSQSFELYIIVLHNTSTDDLQKTANTSKMTLISKEHLSIYIYIYSVHLLLFDHSVLTVTLYLRS